MRSPFDSTEPWAHGIPQKSTNVRAEAFAAPSTPIDLSEVIEGVPPTMRSAELVRETLLSATPS